MTPDEWLAAQNAKAAKARNVAQPVSGESFTKIFEDRLNLIQEEGDSWCSAAVKIIKELSAQALEPHFIEDQVLNGMVNIHRQVFEETFGPHEPYVQPTVVAYFHAYVDPRTGRRRRCLELSWQPKPEHVKMADEDMPFSFNPDKPFEMVIKPAIQLVKNVRFATFIDFTPRMRSSVKRG